MIPMVVFPLLRICSRDVGKFIKVVMHSCALIYGLQKAKRTLLTSYFFSFSYIPLRLHCLSLHTCSFVTQIGSTSSWYQPDLNYRSYVLISTTLLIHLRIVYAWESA